ncbi:DUF3159 domain-containing protein [Amycolatopsis sp. WQ 127309]|uniref:DUF3159 domain-containing protein n=1 Tax=Amycolatopsis sp. WQ 127309 TaxID=2932773 RepID=UPI001FF4B68D|nr:DUF3159 domain-containing protein [Amycolatopsis sp. WQ 127309]UOZ05312.1 DUF3159 domain-containing protein [Amycolatopsis sp. WQ 127309]
MNTNQEVRVPSEPAAPPRKNRWEAVVVTAAPTVAFVAANAVGDLTAGLVTAAVTAIAAFAWRLYRRQPLRQAVLGLLLVAACAAVAAVTGEARGFFLIPALIPFAVIAVCVTTVLIGRPLTGLILNRVAGGPADWRSVPRLRRIYTVSTLTCAAVNVVNGALQVIYYRGNQPLVLGAVHIATGPVFAVIVAVTITCVRRARRG